ncbi:zf-LSD1 domain-containing protein [Citrus sinensis]|nr:zf-LSD1 domain-containing protein [Citrus sinensis]
MTSRVERCGGCGRQLWLPPQAVAARCHACRSVTSFPSSSQRWAQVYGAVSQPHHNVVTTVPSNYLAAGPGNGKYPRQGCDNYYIDQPRPAWAPPPVYGRKKALLCGVTYNDTNYMLTGSINDVKSMWFLLVRMLGFPSDCVVILTEEEKNPYRIPTKQNIRTAMRWLAQDCQPGDSLVFYYSGHGSRQKDYNKDELDGFDETICPLDHETEGPIIDDEINATIVRPLPRGAKLHAIIDSCYSGTVLDLPYVCKINGEEYKWEDQRIPTACYKGTSGGIALSFSACSDNQTSASTSAFSGKDVTGAMTSSFIQAVKNERCLTYGRLLAAMGDAIPSLMPNDTDVIQGVTAQFVGKITNVCNPHVHLPLKRDPGFKPPHKQFCGREIVGVIGPQQFFCALVGVTSFRVIPLRWHPSCPPTAYYGTVCFHAMRVLVGVGIGDLVGVFFVAVGEGVIAAGCSTVMLAIISLKLIFVSFAYVTLLMASSKAATMFSSSSGLDSSSIKIFFLPLFFEVTIGGSSSFSSSSLSSSFSVSTSTTSPFSYCCSSANSHSLSLSSFSYTGITFSAL